MTLKSRRFLGQLGVSLVLLLLLLGHAGGVYDLGFIAQLDAALYDLKVRVFQAPGVDERVVIVDVDEKSLKEIGRWPWPREQARAADPQSVRAVRRRGGGLRRGVRGSRQELPGLPVLENLARGPLAGDGGSPVWRVSAPSWTMTASSPRRWPRGRRSWASISISPSGPRSSAACPPPWSTAPN